MSTFIKICLQCGAAKPAAEGFHRSKKRKSGYEPYCKACNAARYQARKAADPERVREQGRRSAALWRERHPDRHAATQERAKAAKRKPPFVMPTEKPCACCKAVFSLENFPLDPRRRDGRGSYCRPCETAKALERVKRYQAKDPELTRERQRIYKAKESAKQAAKEWRQRPEQREILRVREKVRYARRRCPEGSEGLNRATWSRIVAAFDGACCYCGTAEEKLTLEHIVPLSKGGTNKISNLAPACADCNGRKKNKFIEQFAPDIADSVKLRALRCEQVILLERSAEASASA